MWVPGCPRTDTPGYITGLFPPPPLVLILATEIPLPRGLLLHPSCPDLSTSSWSQLRCPHLDHRVTQQRESPVCWGGSEREEDVVWGSGEGGKLDLFPFLAGVHTHLLAPDYRGEPGGGRGVRRAGTPAAQGRRRPAQAAVRAVSVQSWVRQPAAKMAWAMRAAAVEKGRAWEWDVEPGLIRKWRRRSSAVAARPRSSQVSLAPHILCSQCGLPRLVTPLWPCPSCRCLEGCVPCSPAWSPGAHLRASARRFRA